MNSSATAAINLEHTDITLILDASGSMEPLRKTSVEAINTLIRDQAKLPGTASLTIYTFAGSGDVRCVMLEKPLTSEVVFALSDYVCGGMTALYSALGYVIDETGNRFAAKGPNKQPDKRLIAILTDGEENASQGAYHGEAGRLLVQEKITHQTTKYSWEFRFLGANIDAPKVGASIGIPLRSCATFTANEGGLETAYAGLSRSLTSYRTGAADSEDDLSKLVGPGPADAPAPGPGGPSGLPFDFINTPYIDPAQLSGYAPQAQGDVLVAGGPRRSRAVIRSVQVPAS